MVTRESLSTGHRNREGFRYHDDDVPPLRSSMALDGEARRRRSVRNAARAHRALVEVFTKCDIPPFRVQTAGQPTTDRDDVHNDNTNVNVSRRRAAPTGP